MQTSAAPAAPTTSGSAPAPWLSGNSSWAIILAYVLTVLYVSPIILFTIALAGTSGFRESHWALTWFAAFASNHESTLSEFHKILLPVMAAISAATFDKRNSRSLIVLASTILLFFFWTVAASVLFDIPSISNSIESSVDNFSKDSIMGFFSRIREMLLTFAMMLLGIQVANKTKEK